MPKSQPWTREFTVTHLKKTDGVVYFGGTHNDDPFEYVAYGDFNSRAKGEIKKKLEEHGILYDRYKTYGDGREVLIDNLVNSSAGDLFRICLPDPDVAAAIDLDNSAQGYINYVLQIDYRVGSALDPFASTKIMKSAPSAVFINSGVPIPGVVKEIGKKEYADFKEDEFYKSVGKVTYFRICADRNICQQC